MAIEDYNFSTAPIVGNDNKSPLYNPNGRHQVWSKDDLYLGNAGSNKYVPNIGDLAFELDGRSIVWYIVHAVDQITFVPTLLLEDRSRQTEAFSEDDILYGVGPGTQSDTYRVYLDKSINPHKFSVDRRLKIGGNTSVLCKIFLGADTSDGGVVISGRYDSNGVFISENIPLEIINYQNTNNTNIATKIVSDAYTVYDLNDGDLVTAVFYDNDGEVVSKRQLLVENTGFIRSTDADKKYVTGIALESPFLSNINNKVIQYPINVPLNSMNLIGVVSYSDGSEVRLGIDGTRFKLMGLENYTATIVGQNVSLVLKYTLEDTEDALDVHVGNDKFITETYTVTTVSGNSNYAVLLFVYPEWVDISTGYRLRWFMYDLDRSVSYEVTPNIIINTNISSYNPKAYGTKQTLHVSINLHSVSGSYGNFIHVQIVDVTLNKEGSGRPNIDGISNWNIANVSNSNNTYGINTYATYRVNTSNQWKVRIAPYFTVLSDWLFNIYKKVNPMYDTMLEDGPLDPTHFIVLLGNVTFEFPITQFNQELNVNVLPPNNGTMLVKFIKRTSTRDLNLAIIGLSIYQVNELGNFI